MKNFIRAMSKYCENFQYFNTKFSQMSYANWKGGFLTIEEIMTDTMFQINVGIENEMCLKKCVIAFFEIKKLRFTKNN